MDVRAVPGSNHGATGDQLIYYATIRQFLKDNRI